MPPWHACSREDVWRNNHDPHSFIHSSPSSFHSLAYICVRLKSCGGVWCMVWNCVRWLQKKKTWKWTLFVKLLSLSSWKKNTSAEPLLFLPLSLSLSLSLSLRIGSDNGDCSNWVALGVEDLESGFFDDLSGLDDILILVVDADCQADARRWHELLHVHILGPGKQHTFTIYILNSKRKS